MTLYELLKKKGAFDLVGLCLYSMVEENPNPERDVRGFELRCTVEAGSEVYSAVFSVIYVDQECVLSREHVLSDEIARELEFLFIEASSKYKLLKRAKSLLSILDLEKDANLNQGNIGKLRNVLRTALGKIVSQPLCIGG